MPRPGAKASKSRQQECQANEWECKSCHSLGECSLFTFSLHSLPEDQNSPGKNILLKGKLIINGSFMLFVSCVTNNVCNAFLFIYPGMFLAVLVKYYTQNESVFSTVVSGLDNMASLL